MRNNSTIVGPLLVRKLKDGLREDDPERLKEGHLFSLSILSTVSELEVAVFRPITIIIGLRRVRNKSTIV